MVSFINKNIINKNTVRKHFERAAHTYDEAAVLQHEVCKRMLGRLDYIRLQPNTILDAGCGTGKGSHLLLQKYKKSSLIALDIAYSMLQKTKKQSHWLRKPHLLCADVEQLPLADASINLLFSNLTLQWCNRLPETFTELRRVLAPKGLLMFSSFGPDTLHELRRSWASIDQNPHVNDFVDMHDVGDALLQAGFANPVMDAEVITLTYAEVNDLLHDLKAIGATNAVENRQRGLMTRQRLQQFTQAYEHFRQQDGRLPASYEVIYGHAWVPDAPPPSSPKLDTIQVMPIAK